MFLVVKNAKSNAVTVYTADQAQVDAFNTDDTLPAEIIGWAVNNPSDLEKTALTTKDLLGIYNATQEKPLVKFQDRKQATERTFPALARVAREFDLVQPKQEEPKQEADLAPKTTTGGSRRKGVISLQPHTKAYPCRANTKQAALVDALWKGATMEDLMEACSKVTGGKRDWTENSVKSGIYWDVNKVKGYGVRTEFDKDGTPRYFLVLPKGLEAPVPHKTKKDA